MVVVYGNYKPKTSGGLFFHWRCSLNSSLLMLGRDGLICGLPTRDIMRLKRKDMGILCDENLWDGGFHLEVDIHGLFSLVVLLVVD